MPCNVIFLSIRPRYAEKIIDGTKTVELRRVRPKYISTGALVLMYVSSPVKSLIGAFKVNQVVENPLGDLWKLVQNRAGISRSEFDAYFEGASTGVGIFFNEIQLFHNPIELEDLKLIGFRPPQGFRYAKVSELASPRFAGLVGDMEFSTQVSFLDRMNL